MASKRKLGFIGAAVIIILLLLGVFVVPLVTESPPAVLVVESGTVEVEQSPARLVTGEVALKQGDVIRTGADGRASLVLSGGSVVRLDSNTEISLKELSGQGKAKKVSIDQKAGRVWSRVVRLSGVDSYQISTPRSVATVRGTGFDNWIMASTFIQIGVVDGLVNVEKTEDETAVDVEGGFAVAVTDDPLVVERLAEDDWIKENKAKDEAWTLSLRDKIKSKYWVYIELAKAQYKLTDEQVNQYIDDAIAGRYSQDDIDAVLDQFGLEIKL